MRGYTAAMVTDDTRRGWNDRAILHVDMDAFFAAVEQLDHPEWRGLPVVVGGSPQGRGVISAASYEARRYGVRSATPSATAQRLLPPEAVWAPGRFDRYREVSAMVLEVFLAQTPHVEQTSIDEAYLDVTPTAGRPDDPVSVARRIQATVDDIGLSCSVGVASSKTVAKIASDRDKPHGLTVVRPGSEASFLAPLPVGLMPGIGGVSARRLVDHGVTTLGELAALDDTVARDLLGSWGPDLTSRARGVDSSAVRPSSRVRSVSRERTFPHDVRSESEVGVALKDICGQVSSRLRRKGMAGRTVTVKLRYSDFTTRTVSRTLPAATDDSAEFGPVAASLLRSVWVPGTGLRLLGVGLSNLERPAEQLGLFARDGSGRDGLSESLERIRERFGEHAVDVGTGGIIERQAGRGPVAGPDRPASDQPASANDSSSGA